LPFFIAGLLELVLVILQFVNKRSIQGVFYFLGERYMTLSTPGIAKATLQGTELLRPYGTFSHPNSLAGFYLLLYFFVLTNKSTRNNLLKYPLLFISTVLVFFSFSKIAIVTLLILNTLYLMLKINKCKVCLLAKLTVPIIVGFIFFSAQTDPLSLDKRLALVANAWQTFLNHPLFGVGLGSYLVAQNQFPIKYPYFFLQPVHNIFLLFLSETGIIISGSVLWILIKKIKKTFLTTNYLLLVAVFITGFFDHYWLTLQQNILLLIYLFSTL
jgi:O-antigen ligase